MQVWTETGFWIKGQVLNRRLIFSDVVNRVGKITDFGLKKGNGVLGTGPHRTEAGGSTPFVSGSIPTDRKLTRFKTLYSKYYPSKGEKENLV